jgi:hypothetical protein
MIYRILLIVGNFIVLYLFLNFFFYLDISGELERSNDTHNIGVIIGPIQEMFV